MLHLPVKDRAGIPELRAGGGALFGKKKKKLSKRQLANAARAKHRGTFLDQLMRELDPSTLTTNPHLEFVLNPEKLENISLYGDPELPPDAYTEWEDWKAAR